MKGETVDARAELHERDRSRVRSSKGWVRLGPVLAVLALIVAGCGGASAEEDAREQGAAGTEAQPAHPHDTEANAASDVRIVRADSSPTTMVGADLVHCIATAEQTGGGYSFLEIDVPAGGGPVAPHQHPSAEWFYILSGTASIQVGEAQTDVGPGDYFHVPPATTHTFTATSDLRLVAGYSPGGEEGRLFCPN